MSPWETRETQYFEQEEEEDDDTDEGTDDDDDSDDNDSEDTAAAANASNRAAATAYHQWNQNMQRMNAMYVTNGMVQNTTSGVAYNNSYAFAPDLQHAAYGNPMQYIPSGPANTSSVQNAALQARRMQVEQHRQRPHIPLQQQATPALTYPSMLPAQYQLASTQGLTTPHQAYPTAGPSAYHAQAHPAQPPFDEPTHIQQMQQWGYRINRTGGWRCAWPHCKSQKIFHKAYDLRKHFKRHSREFVCRKDLQCPKTFDGFATERDRERHEASHDPRVVCEYEGCDRVFSRTDNMRDHYRRVHGDQG